MTVLWQKLGNMEFVTTAVYDYENPIGLTRIEFYADYVQEGCVFETKDKPSFS